VPCHVHILFPACLNNSSSSETRNNFDTAQHSTTRRCPVASLGSMILECVWLSLSLWCVCICNKLAAKERRRKKVTGLRSLLVVRVPFTRSLTIFSNGMNCLASESIYLSLTLACVVFHLNLHPYIPLQRHISTLPSSISPPSTAVLSISFLYTPLQT
jgi:F0F1-type ATP synthase membrane subunit a